MAYNWGRANKTITDQTPMVGSVAWWNAGDGVGSSGHVAYVAAGGLRDARSSSPRTAGAATSTGDGSRSPAAAGPRASSTSTTARSRTPRPRPSAARRRSARRSPRRPAPGTSARDAGLPVAGQRQGDRRRDDGRRSRRRSGCSASSCPCASRPPTAATSPGPPHRCAPRPVAPGTMASTAAPAVSGTLARGRGAHRARRHLVAQADSTTIQWYADGKADHRRDRPHPPPRTGPVPQDDHGADDRAPRRLQGIDGLLAPPTARRRRRD